MYSSLHLLKATNINHKWWQHSHWTNSSFFLPSVSVYPSVQPPSKQAVIVLQLYPNKHTDRHTHTHTSMHSRTRARTHTHTIWLVASMRTYSRVLAGREWNCRPLFQKDTEQQIPHTQHKHFHLFTSLTVLFSVFTLHFSLQLNCTNELIYFFYYCPWVCPMFLLKHTHFPMKLCY